jgi:hypothetical protein
VIRYGNTLPNWIADTSKISPQNPIIHRANPILLLAHLTFVTVIAHCGFAAVDKLNFAKP